MKLKTIGCIFGVLCLVVLVAVGGLLWAVFSTPASYAQAQEELDAIPVAERQANAAEVERRAEQFVENISLKEEWSAEFTQNELNSWLVEKLAEVDGDYVPDGISNPLVRLVENQIQIGFQLSYNNFNGIVTVDVEPEVRSERQLAIRFKGVRAGAITVPVDDLLAEITQEAEDTDKWTIEMQREGDDHVAIVTFKSDPETGPKLKSIEVQEGKFTVRGETTPQATPEEPADSDEGTSK